MTPSLRGFQAQTPPRPYMEAKAAPEWRARASIGRRGFGTDLQMLAEASAEDFMEALNIAKPSDPIGSACSRPGMPAKAKTALRTLLLSIPTCLAQRSGRLHFAVTGTGTTSSLARPDSSSHQTSRIPTTF